MKEFSINLKEKLKRFDFWILGSSIGMTLLSVITLYAASDAVGSKRPVIQFFAMAMGVLAMGAMSLVDYQSQLRKLAIPLYILSVLAIGVIMVIGTGASANTWLKFDKIGLSLQPSEFVKFTFLITFSQHLELVREKINKPQHVLLLLAHAGIIIGLVVLSGDLGSALVFAFMMVFMLFMAGLSGWYFLIAAVLVFAALPIVWTFLKDYQKERIIYGFRPELDPIHWGYQALMSKAAIVSGGFTGAGFDGGTYYKIVPAKQSDMLFCVLAEKFGFFGTLAYLILITVLVIRLLIVCRRLTVPSTKYVCIGTVAMLIFQALENIGMCLAMLPVIGITLPLFSYGGSSVLSIFLCLGLIQNAEIHNTKYFNPMILD